MQATRGEIEPNAQRYGAGFDAYIDPEELAGVDLLYEELRGRGASIVAAPAMTPYGGYEFVLEDIDGRRVGIGRIKDEDVFFKNRCR